MSSTTVSPSPSLPAANSTPAPRTATVPAWVGVALCLLLAAAQLSLGGYQLGVGNQSIQIAFLKHWAAPWLYSSDPMVLQTMPAYPSFFFYLLSPLLAVMNVESLYLLGQTITSFLTLAVVYGLGRSIYHSHATAIAAAALLVGGHLGALAGDALYSIGFTHTFAALPLAVAALALAYRGRWVWAFAFAGILFNLHALTAVYTLLMLAAALLADVREIRPAEWLTRAVLCAAIVLAIASPTLALIFAHPQNFDAQWLNLMRIRSADHSFPSAWWVVGDTGIPRYTLLLALFVLSWSFSPLRRPPESGGAKRGTQITVLMTLAVLGLFAVGYVFTEIWPIPTVIRLQPFRASRLLMVLMLVHIAHAAIAAIRAGATGVTQTAAGGDLRLPPTARLCEIFAGILVLATLGVPSLLPLLPLTLLVTLATALVAGHLSWRQAAVAVAALLVALLAHVQIQFPVPLLSKDLYLLPHTGRSPDITAFHALAALSLLMALAMGILLALNRRHRTRLILAAVTFFSGCFFLGASATFPRRLADQLSPENAALVNVSAWARRQTATDAIFLTPSNLANFRISSERALVGSWRDGTQIYFAASFGPAWFDRVSGLEPGLTVTRDGTRLLSRGQPLETRGDDDLIALADQFHANYILLPTSSKGSSPHLLAAAYSDADYTVFLPQLRPPPEVPVPVGVLNRDNWLAAEDFMNTTVARNIEKYRKADVTFQIVDPAGRPVRNLAIKADQTRQAFDVGVSLGFFEPNDIVPINDGKPPLVRPVELQKTPEIFSASMIPFSAKWIYIEPAKGQYRWSDLDKYVDYAATNGLTLEFHHLAGVLPMWVYNMGGNDGQSGLSFPPPIPALQKEFDRHCFDTVARYADRVKYWQVVNEKYMMQYVPSVMKELQKRYPNNKFGISDCVRFWDGIADASPAAAAAAQSGRRNLRSIQYKGADAVDWLLAQDIHPDFFSIHGHWPLNLWPDPREMYSVIDYFQERNVRVHITEHLLQIGGPIRGPLRAGTLTPDLQGECLARILTVAFSHPNVDLVNLWGLAPDGWGSTNSGLIDAADKTRPAWNVLKKLVTETWRSHAAGQLSLDGACLVRVFHGTYSVTVTLPNGKQAVATVQVPQKPTAHIRLQLDPDKAALTLLK
jgi:hypothetical protein